MNLMNYEGYVAKIEYSDEDQCLVGHVINVPDTTIAFHADSVSEIEKVFHETVAGYITDCQAQGEEPRKPYSGRFVLRLPPEQHAAITAAAAREGKSLNAWAVERLMLLRQIQADVAQLAEGGKELQTEIATAGKQSSPRRSMPSLARTRATHYHRDAKPSPT